MDMTLEWSSLKKLPEQRRLVVLRGLAEATVVANWNYIIENPGCPSIKDYLKLNPRMRVRRASAEAWRDIPRIIALGWGDEKDFALWRVAELRNAGRDDVAPHIKMSAAGDLVILARNQEVVENPVAGLLDS